MIGKKEQDIWNRARPLWTSHSFGCVRFVQKDKELFFLRCHNLDHDEDTWDVAMHTRGDIGLALPEREARLLCSWLNAHWPKDK